LIAAGSLLLRVACRYDFETMARLLWKPGIHHSHRMRKRASGEKAVKSAVSGVEAGRLSVRLMSL
jgi:hypothetical protein